MYVKLLSMYKWSCFFLRHESRIICKNHWLK